MGWKEDWKKKVDDYVKSEKSKSRDQIIKDSVNTVMMMGTKPKFKGVSGNSRKLIRSATKANKGKFLSDLRFKLKKIKLK